MVGHVSSDESNGERRKVGDGFATRPAPDVVFVKVNGTLEADDVATEMDWANQVNMETGRSFILADMSDGVNVTAAARRHMVNYAKERPLSGVVFYAASFQMRVLGNLVFNALNLMRKEPQPFTIVDTRPDAEAWIEEQRQKIGGGTTS